jgi:iron complex transport system substrate-binding protein
MMRRLVLFLIAAAVLITAIAEVGAAAERRRIVSVGGAVTEIVAALGAADDLVAVDTTSVYPPAIVAPLPKVGYMRQLAAEGIIALKPSELLVVEGSGPPGTLQVLADAGVKPVMIPDTFSPEGVGAKVRAVGAALGRDAEADRLAADLARRFATVTAGNASILRPVRVLFALSLQGGRLMASGAGTAADGAIRLAGGVNALADFAGYKAVGDEAIIAARPDVVLVMDRHELNPKEILAYPALAATPAGASGRLMTVDGVALLGFGPRTADAIADLRRRLYPDLAFAPLPDKLP